MSITGTILHKKVREILPGLTSGITPEVLNKTCEDPVAQPFFRWFCSNVGRDNYLPPEDIRLEKHIKKCGEWLEGEELDSALAEATKDCPDLMDFLAGDSSIGTRLSDKLEAEKESYKEDTDYLQTLEESLRTLKELGLKLEDDIEAEESQLEKDRIKVHKVYTDCTSTFEEFDTSHRQFFRDIESLVQVYADAVEKKCAPVVWTQLPLDNFIKQMEMHNEYLGIYMKRYLDGKAEQGNDSDYGTLTDDRKERCSDDKVYELLNCQTNVITSKTDEINAKVNEAAGVAIAAYVIDISNNSRSMIPQSEAQIRMEISSLTSKRDFHEENIELLREKQLKEVVRQYGRFVITKILVDDGHVRAERRRSRLEKLEKLRTLAREKGHGHSDLLCMLILLQLRRLNQVVEFIADGRHYLATEYNLISVRSDIMREQQEKFDAILRSSPKDQNVFNKILTSLLFGADGNPEDSNVATKQYDELIQRNEKRRETLLGVGHDTRIAKLKKLQDEIMASYDEEMKGPTKSLKPVSYELLKRLEVSTRRVRVIQDIVTEIRAKIKDMTRKTSENSFERETTIMWQRFLADPEELQSKYDEAKRKFENSHFSVTSDL